MATRNITSSDCSTAQTRHLTGRGSVYPITRPRPQVREHWHHTISRRATARQPQSRGSVSQSCLEGSEKHLVRLRARADSMIHPRLVDPRVLARGPTL